jgi:hypothetical protein
MKKTKVIKKIPSALSLSDRINYAIEHEVWKYSLECKQYNIKEIEVNKLSEKIYKSVMPIIIGVCV